MTAKEQVLVEALRLQPSDRAELAAALLARLDETEEAGAAEAWDAEVARRAAEVDAGKVRPVADGELWHRLRDDEG